MASLHVRGAELHIRSWRRDLGAWLMAVAAVFLGYRCETIADAILASIGIGIGQAVVWWFVWFPGEADIVVIEKQEVDRG